MLRYTPGETPAHRPDPRPKLAFQGGFALAAFAYTTITWLLGMTACGLVVLLGSGVSIRRTLRAYWFVLLFLALGPVIAALTLGPPWVDIDRGVRSARAVSRVVPVLFVSGAYIHSTPVRDTRAAVQRTIPGRPGRLLGVGMALTVRSLVLVRDDLSQIRAAVLARGGANRPLHDRMRRIATLSVGRAFGRTDRLSAALQARAFAWNPTLPRLTFSWIDYPVVVLSLGLAVTPFL
jgi:biotin transport system permease protein